jgi:2-polyprenyl-3-methyl-5-hydroxy-6-metoxy-1,4-benzoquinol methylase
MIATDHFHETDPSGLQTLERFANAPRFNRWMFNTIRRYCRGHVLEVGSGIGNLSKLYLEHNMPLTVSDLRTEYCTILQQKFGSNPLLRGIESVELALPDFNEKYSPLMGRFDTVVASNVVEHIADDRLAIQNCMDMLKPGGHVIILVPAYQALYNEFDTELGHFRRYTKRSLVSLLKEAGLQVMHQQYFNAVGMAGWVLNGNIRKKKLIPAAQLRFFDKMVPVVKLVDLLTFHQIGLSVIAVGRKP